MTTVADALLNTTGVSLKPVDRERNNLSVRGFEINSFQLDGVPVATGNIGIETGNTAIYDRVEVVRGATGLLSGAGDPSVVGFRKSPKIAGVTFRVTDESELRSQPKQAVFLTIRFRPSNGGPSASTC